MNYTLHPKPYALIIGWLYPDLMSTYGDRGNVICLAKRCQWRGIKVEVRHLNADSDHKLLATCDLLFMGGAQDRQQKIASEDLRKNKGPVIKKMVEDGAPALFVCAAYQFMGHFYRPAEGEDIPGLGIFDLHTIHPGSDKPRCIGNVVIRADSAWRVAGGNQSASYQLPATSFLVGFENHGGRTYLGIGVEPLGEIMVGYGNNGDLPASLDGGQWQAGDKTEGAVYKNAFGTYLHGPVLPKNPHFADLLIKLALEKKYGSVELKPLDDELEWLAHKAIARRLGVKV